LVDDECGFWGEALILLLRARHRQLITDEFERAAGNGQKVLEYLFQHPIVSTVEMQNLIQTTYQTANNTLVNQFVANGVLEEMTGQKCNRRFVYREYIDLFQALLQQLAKIAVSKDCGRFEWSVLEGNEPAIRFYRSIGAEPQNEWIGYRLAG
tara:strand:+ start:33782 stop:34240 length:459 start_codon:yes stop_codon:yes gene_type:complete